MLSFFWFQNSLHTDYEALDANAVDNEGSEQAYGLAPEFKKVTAVLNDIEHQKIINLDFQMNTLMKETIQGLNET